MLPQDPSIPLLGIYPKEVLAYYKDTCSALFIAAIFIIDRTWKQPRCLSTEERKKKIWYSSLMEYYSTVKNNDIMKYAGKLMGLEKNYSEGGNPGPQR